MKVDKIFPDNWKEVIQGKRVIFYNTGVSSLLHGREKRIEKMKWVFQVFKENPDVVLWWRPHPLEISTLQSMHPELEEQYREVRQCYIEENIGILDESADLNRAIAVSDAYYGAWSSVVELYKVAKKPVLFESNKVKEMMETSFLPSAFCVKNEDIWFIQLNSNKLVRMNRVNYEVKEIVIIPCEPPFQSRYHSCHIVDIGKSLLLLLGKNERIYEYELRTGMIKIHRPQIENYIFNSELVIENKSELLVFPNERSDVLVYDYFTGAIEQRIFFGKNIKAAKCHEAIGSKLYVMDSGSNTLYCYDFSDESDTEINIGADDNKYWGVKKAGKYFVLPHIEKKAITLWNEESGEIIELTEFPERYVSWEEYAYLDAFEKNGNIYIFPSYGNMVLEVDVKNKVINQVFDDVFFDAYYDINSEDCTGITYACVGKYKELVYAYSFIKNCWQIFNLDTMDMQEVSFSEVKSEQHKVLLECLLDNKVYKNPFCEFENPLICNLKNYIKNLADNYENHYLAECIENDIGTKIHNFITSVL